MIQTKLKKVGKKMKKKFTILAALILCLYISGCGNKTAADVSKDNESSSVQTNAQGNENNAPEADGAANTYDTDLQMFVVDSKYMEAQWTFSEGIVFDAIVLPKEAQGDEYNPQVTLTFSGGKDKDATDNIALDYNYFSVQNEENLSPDLKQLFDSAQVVVNNKETAECEITKEIQGNTLILRIKASENSSFDFTAFKWFSTKIRFGYDETSAVFKEYSDSEVISDYSLNAYPNPEYVKAEPENLSQEITFDNENFTVGSKYYTIYKFEVPKVFVFNDDWYYSEAWDTWNFTSLSEKESAITEYQITSYDDAGNVISHETRTVFPSQGDLLSSYRGDKGTCESEKDMTFETTESRLAYFYEFYADSCPDIRVEDNILYNGDYFICNVQFDEMYDFSAFQPDADGYVNETVSYKFQVEGGYSAKDYQMNVTAYYSVASLYPKN